MRDRQSRSGNGVREQKDTQLYWSPEVGENEQSPLDGSQGKLCFWWTARLWLSLRGRGRTLERRLMHKQIMTMTAYHMTLQLSGAVLYSGLQTGLGRLKLCSKFLNECMECAKWQLREMCEVQWQYRRRSYLRKSEGSCQEEKEGREELLLALPAKG